MVQILYEEQFYVKLLRISITTIYNFKWFKNLERGTKMHHTTTGNFIFGFSFFGFDSSRLGLLTESLSWIWAGVVSLDVTDAESAIPQRWGKCGSSSIGTLGERSGQRLYHPLWIYVEETVPYQKLCRRSYR